MNKNVFIENVPIAISESDLLAICSEIGEVQKLAPIPDMDDGIVTNKVIVAFASAEDAKAAVQALDGITISGSKIHVHL